jgi:hypothetical protein
MTEPATCSTALPRVRSIGRLTEVTRVLLIVSIARTTIRILLLAARGLFPSVIGLSMGYALLSGGNHGRSWLTNPWVIFDIAVQVFFLIWVYRACRNALVLGGTVMTFSPGLAVGCYFVPIANLWMPYTAMKEIWLASRHTQEDPGGLSSISVLIGWWWALMIMMGIGNLLMLLFVLRAALRPNLSISNPKWILLELIHIAAQALTVAVIMRIAAMQESRLPTLAVPVRQ